MRKVIWLAFAIFLGLTDAMAQQVSDLRISVFGGGSVLAANRTFSIDGDLLNTKYETGPRFGLRGTGSISERISVEGSYSLVRNNLRVTNVRAMPVLRLFELKPHQFSGNALYYLTRVGDVYKP